MSTQFSTVFIFSFYQSYSPIGILGIVNSAINDLVLSVKIEGVQFQNAIITLEEWIPV